MEGLDPSKYIAALRIKNAGKDWQPTRHQQDAVETAELFGDKEFKDRRSLLIYLRLFAQYRDFREEMLRCREWVASRGARNPGRLFVAVLPKFLRPKPFTPKHKSS